MNELVTKKRNVFVTIGLCLTMIIPIFLFYAGIHDMGILDLFRKSEYGFAVNFAVWKDLHGPYGEFGHFLSDLIYLFIGLLGIISMIFLFRRKKWGFWGFCASCVAVIIWMAVSHIMWQINENIPIGTGFKSDFWWQITVILRDYAMWVLFPVALWAILQIKKEGVSCWKHLK